MRPEKATIVEDLQAKLNHSPFLLVADYTGLKVDQFKRTAHPARRARGRRMQKSSKTPFSAAPPRTRGFPTWVS